MTNRFAATIRATAFSAIILTSLPASSADTVKLAFAGPVTGPVAQYGEMQMNGSVMAAEQINAAGGINGKKIEYKIFDDVCEPKQAVAVANKIVNEGYQIVIGHLCSGSTQPASDVYDDEGLLMVSPASTNPDITLRGMPMVFRTIGLDSQQGNVGGQYIVHKAKPKKLAIIHDKQQYGQGVAEEVLKALAQHDVKPVIFEGINKGQKDFAALITKMKSENIDFVYYGGYHPELGLMLRQSKEQGFMAQWMGPEASGNKDLSAIAGEASEGLIVTLPADFSKDPKNADLVKAFKDKNQDPTGPFVMPSYAAVKVVADAIAATKSEDPKTLTKYMKANIFETPIGTVQFDEKGDLKAFRFEVFRWHADATKSPIE